MGMRHLFNPSLYQGRSKKRSYFEGWYFKQTSQTQFDEKDPDVIAVIPGVSMDKNGEKHAFIQVFSSLEEKTWYISYPFPSFFADKKELRLTIDNNIFSKDGLSLDIDYQDLQLKGVLKFTDREGFPQKLLAPGIMGWYSFVPFMECFHGVVSMKHIVNGSLVLNGRTIDFSRGSGYIEKDWGVSFPSAWVWMQSCDFQDKKSSCMLSVARIPFLGRVFTGFLGFVLYNDTLLRFGSYTGAKILTLKADGDCTHVVIRQRNTLIEFSAEMGVSGHLAAPRQGKMDRTIQESLNGTISVTISTAGKNNIKNILFKDIGRLAGLEVSEVEEILKLN
jgi:tocopherol cyclase